MKVPKSKTILNFLLCKGWRLQKIEPPFYFLTPPKEIKFERKNFVYRVPLNEKAEDYERFALVLINSIAEVHELDKKQLLNLLNQMSSSKLEPQPA